MSYLFFARWFGLISIILALGILFNPKNAREMAKGMINTETGYVMGAVLPIVFGSLAFMHHHAFESGPRLIIDIIGLSMILLGTFKAWFPQQWRKILGEHIDIVPPMFALFGMMFGFILLYVGFISPLIR